MRRSWIVDSRAANEFHELTELVKCMLLKPANSAELNGRVKAMCMMGLQVVGLSRTSDSCDMARPGKGPRDGSFAGGAPYAGILHTDASRSKGARRGVGKSWYDELMGRGFAEGALPLALRSAMTLAVGHASPRVA